MIKIVAIAVFSLIAYTTAATMTTPEAHCASGKCPPIACHGTNGCPQGCHCIDDGTRVPRCG